MRIDSYHVYSILALALFVWIGFHVARIDIAMTDFRPVRVYNFNDNREFGVSRVDKLEICERFADAARGE